MRPAPAKRAFTARPWTLWPRSGRRTPPTAVPRLLTPLAPGHVRRQVKAGRPGLPVDRRADLWSPPDPANAPPGRPAVVHVHQRHPRRLALAPETFNRWHAFSLSSRSAPGGDVELEEVVPAVERLRRERVDVGAVGERGPLAGRPGGAWPGRQCSPVCSSVHWQARNTGTLTLSTNVTGASGSATAARHLAAFAPDLGHQVHGLAVEGLVGRPVASPCWIRS